ncbi:Translation initiation factor 3 subunit J component [Tilletia horrida]|nr:Translation initiation factor 3 subunit J component [Tilletia horrida]
MSDWDADSADEKAAPAKATPSYTPAASAAPAFRRNFDDEEEDDVKDDWDDDEEEEEEAKKKAAAAAAASSAPSKKRGTVKQKIAEKEAEERRRAELGLDDDEEEEEDEDDPAARRKREREAQIRADVDNAASLLGTSRISASDDPLVKLRSANPVSKEDWESYANSLFTELLKKQSTRPGFDKFFAHSLTKLVYQPLRDVEIRKGSTKLRELAEEKVKAEKEAKKNPGGKKPKPKTIGTSSAKNVMDLSSYGNEALDDGDDLDFM